MDKRLRLMAAKVIFGSTKLNKESKNQLFNFIQKEGTDAQVKALLLDGKILINIDEQTEEIINARFASHKTLSELGAVGGTLASLFTLGAYQAWRTLASQYSDAHKQCGTHKISNDRDACIAKARMNFANKRISMLNKVLSTCGQQKNTDRCKKTILKNIAKETSKLDKQKKKLQKLVMKGRGQTGEPGQIVATRS